MPGTRAFSAATMYATVRRVLDLWEDYLGHRIDWHFESDFARLELIPLIEWDDAPSGHGFLESGFGRRPNGAIDDDLPYCENFDVFTEVGTPSGPADTGIDHAGLHESGGDLTATIARLHFDSSVAHPLDETKGNLLTVNGLDRVGELSDSREIRVTFDSRRTWRTAVCGPRRRPSPRPGCSSSTRRRPSFRRRTPARRRSDRAGGPRRRPQP